MTCIAPFYGIACCLLGAWLHEYRQTTCIAPFMVLHVAFSAHGKWLREHRQQTHMQARGHAGTQTGRHAGGRRTAGTSRPPCCAPPGLSRSREESINANTLSKTTTNKQHNISISLSLYIYIYIYIHIYIYIYMHNLSLSLYIYIYIYTCLSLSLSLYM